jgi:predicted  nucleic acid-binding Zn-ribbon protein
MNRSILIVICDFLLLSLLTFSTDLSKVAGENEGSGATVKVDVLAKTANTGGNDLAEVMKQALGEEQKNREQLQTELAKVREATRQQQEQFEQQAKDLQQKQSNLEQQYVTAQSDIQALNQKLQSSSAETSMTKEQLAAKEAEIQKQKDLATALQKQLAQLNNQLHAVDVEKRIAIGQIALMQQQVQAERAANARLAEGVKALATNSSALTREIRENRALAPNTIFSEFVTNRVLTKFVATRSAFLGVNTSTPTKTETVLVTDGTNTFALCHVQDTPLTLWDPGTDWEMLTGTLAHNQVQVPIHALSFHLQDPRVVFMPVTQAEAAQLGCKIYQISSDPYKFQDAVVVDVEAGYYGQCSFQIELNLPQYVKLDRNRLKGLFGKFNPSRGDLVFSRNGELLGVMANSTYCLVLHDFASDVTFPFGRNIQILHTGDDLSRLYSYVFNLPSKLK